ncbi:MAG: bifunctional pyr operon transcriptional regulator/uracil phosphoribosyltransferase PyrR [Sedimentisphaerales bacterium]|nr:bifunctional pyr operon transcriptional regulator/uracil phosphoribosyltransferase PyrR [Sedimentisphaerales bacterium]
MSTILDKQQIEQIITKLANDIFDDSPKDAALATIGIRSRGELLANRLADKLTDIVKKEIPCGTLDITLYRDDLNSASPGQPQVRTTEIGFDIDDKVIILVDDVLHTGRSTRAAMDALIDLGRPKAIRLAVLVERKGRELPIQADFVGYKADVDVDKVVQVNLTECDGRDEVTIQ